jgi:hypothetical protein
LCRGSHFVPWHRVPKEAVYDLASTIGSGGGGGVVCAEALFGNLTVAASLHA